MIIARQEYIAQYWVACQRYGVRSEYGPRSTLVQWDFFLSHSGKDTDEAVAIARWIERQNHSVYIDAMDDEVNSERRDLDRYLGGKIRAARRIVLVWSRNVRDEGSQTGSWWVPFEAGYAVGDKARGRVEEDKVGILVRLDGTPLPKGMSILEAWKTGTIGRWETEAVESRLQSEMPRHMKRTGMG